MIRGPRAGRRRRWYNTARMKTSRGDADVDTRGDESRRRRGCVATPRRQDARAGKRPSDRFGRYIDRLRLRLRRRQRLGLRSVPRPSGHQIRRPVGLKGRQRCNNHRTRSLRLAEKSRRPRRGRGRSLGGISTWHPAAVLPPVGGIITRHPAPSPRRGRPQVLVRRAALPPGLLARGRGRRALPLRRGGPGRAERPRRGARLGLGLALLPALPLGRLVSGAGPGGLAL